MYGKKREAKRHPNWIQRFSTAALLVIAPVGTAVWGAHPSMQTGNQGAIPNAPSAADTSGSAPMLSSLLGSFSKDRAAVRNRMKAVKNKVSEQMSGLSDLNPLKRNQQPGNGADGMMQAGADPYQQMPYPQGQYPQSPYQQGPYQQGQYQQGQYSQSQYSQSQYPQGQFAAASNPQTSRSAGQPRSAQLGQHQAVMNRTAPKLMGSASKSSPSSQMASNQQAFQSPQDQQQYQMMKTLQEQYPQGQFQIVANPDNPQEQIIVVQNPQDIYPEMLQQETAGQSTGAFSSSEIPVSSLKPQTLPSQSLSPQAVPVPAVESPVSIASKPVQPKRTPLVAAEPISAGKSSAGLKKDAPAADDNSGSGNLILNSLISDLSMKNNSAAKPALANPKTEKAEPQAADAVKDEAAKEEAVAVNDAPAAVEEPVPLTVKQETASHTAAETEKTASDSLLEVPSLLTNQMETADNTETAKADQAASDADSDILYQMPVIEINATGAKRIMVGQESEYLLRVKNSSSVPANALVVTTAVPEGIDITMLQPTAGTSRIVEGAKNTEKEEPAAEQSPYDLVISDGIASDNTVSFDTALDDAASDSTAADKKSECVWKVGTLEPGAEETLQLKFIPRVRSNIDFVSDYEYEKTSIASGIEVQEPVLELAIDGNDTIDWGVEDKYRMVVRNTGNGEAQNLTLTVATGDSDSASRTIEKLAPGEEKTMEINIKTVLDGEMKIKIDAAADYGFTASAEKTIEILRGKLDLFVEAPEMQFVNDTVDYLVHIGNTGTSALSNVEVAAAIPANVEYLSCSGDGELDSEKNRVLWTIPTIKPDEELVYQVTGKMLRSGSSRFDVTAADKTGIAASSDATVMVDAIAALEMKINKPSGPVAIGSEVEYEVVISNSGTKAAEEINAGFLLNDGLIPLSVDGGGKVMDGGSRVVFNKVSFLGPGQSVTYKVRAKAERAGNLKVQAILNSAPDEIQLVAEEMSHFYTRKTISRKNNANTENGAAQEMVAMKPEQSVSNHSASNQPAVPQAAVPAPLEPASMEEIPVTLPGPKF